MRWLDALTGRSPVVAQAETGPAFAIGTSEIDPALFGITSYSDPIAPAPRISRSEAIQVPAVKRCRDLIAGSLGQLPLDVIDTEKVTTVNDLLTQPERNKGRSVTMTRTAEDLLFEGVAWWRIVERAWDGYPKSVARLDPRSITIKQDQKVYYRRDGMVQGSVDEWIPDRDLIRFDSPNDALLVAGARAIRTCLKLDAAAAMYADSPRPLGFFSPADGADPAADADIATMLDDWHTARKTNADAYIPAALKYNPTQFTPEQIQLADARQHAVLEIARVAGVDPEELGVSTTSRTYQNQQDRRKDFLDFTVGPYLRAIEDRLSLGDVTKRGYHVRFNLDAFLRSDSKTRMETYKTALEVGAITQAEIRELEDRPALPTGAQMPQAITQPAPTASQFSEAQIAFKLDATSDHTTFSVDISKRTIRGLAVPYGVTARSDGKLWQFGKGTLAFSDVSRVKLLAGHNWDKAIGKAVALEDTDAGLVATFQVARGDAGDEALVMAEDGVWDGLSIGVAQGGKYQERDGVMFAVSAPLAEISLTPCPAYDEARVTEVAASNDLTKGTPMADTTAKNEATESAPAYTFTNEQTRAIEAAIKAASVPIQVPDTISATEGLVVTEALPYRFDGLRGQHEFSSDLFAAHKHNDGEAANRIDKFMEAAFDVTTTNVATVNPVRQRPDMFVDGLAQRTPVWDAMDKGSLPDGTPFVVPKLNTATNLVADHVEGQEPAVEGAYSTTSQTITPTALSGKVQLTREVVDAGGSPQVSSLIWKAVVRAYNEALEAKAVALLDGLTPTAIALTTADITPGIELEAAFAGLQFVTGGDRFDKLVLQADLYKALVAQVDGTGRPLYPMLGATNANGQVAFGFGSIMIGGKVGVPAWALGASGLVSESSYLFASEDVHGWATPPRRFTFEYQVSTVDLAVWGYVATANTRLAGVREITYDPSAS